jgi:hypothetical protein
MLYFNRVTLVFLTQSVCTIAFGIYCLLIVINFVEMFNTNLKLLERKRKNDSWLQDQCKDPQFVHHMRNHIDLCETVEREALTNPYLTATQMALDGLHLCGSYSCEKLLVSLTMSLRMSIYAWIATIGGLLVILPLCVLPLYRRWQRNILLHENHLGENAAVPTVYIRDGIGNMNRAFLHNVPTHGITEPRQRRLLGDTGQVTTQEPPDHLNQTRYLPHYHQM